MKRPAVTAASLIERISDGLELLGAAMVVLMMLLIVYEVVLRYVFHRAPMLADEFGGYMLVAVTFLGLAYVTRQKAHVRLQLLTRSLSEKAANRLRLITLAAFLTYAILLTYLTVELVLYSHRRGLRAESWVRTPEYLPQIVMPLGFAVLTLQLLVEVVLALRAARGSR